MLDGMAERELYAPVKRFLQDQGYEVKGEIGACDLMAIRGDEPPIVVELKERLELALVLQAVDRLSVIETVYVAFRAESGRRGAWTTRRKQVLALFRRLGLGLLTVSSDGRVVPALDPGPYRPRPRLNRRRRLLKEFAERAGDPEVGGSASSKRLTAYRQDALRCAMALSDVEVASPAELRDAVGVARAGTILRDNHYGWFERVRRGQYRLTDVGVRELTEWSDRLGPGSAIRR